MSSSRKLDGTAGIASLSLLDLDRINSVFPTNEFFSGLLGSSRALLRDSRGFVVTERGLIVVEADAGLVTEIDAAGRRRVLAEIPPGTQAASQALPPSQIFNGIAVAPDGRLYVPGETNRSLYRISD